MKRKILLSLCVLSTVFSFIACSRSGEESSTSSAETHTCASCGITFEGPCTTDVFGECVCSEGCSGR